MAKLVDGFSATTLSDLIHQKFMHDEFNASQADSTNKNALKDGIEIVSVDNAANWWPRNPLAEIYAFRGREVDKLGWRNHIHFLELPFSKEFSENDNSDIQGTVYFVKRFQDGEIACTVRVHPSIDLFDRDISMIGLNLPHLIGDGQSLPLAQDVFETSRVILDDERLPRKLPDGSRNTDRSKAALECLAASAVYSEVGNYRGFFCFMPDRVWNATYPQLGLSVERLGPNVKMQDGPGEPEYEVYAGYLEFTPERLENVKRISGIYPSSLKYGTPPKERIEQIIEYADKLRSAGQAGKDFSDQSNDPGGKPDVTPNS